MKQKNTPQWAIWLAWLLAGALVGGVISIFLPKMYRAQATVVVDMNSEQTWSGSPDNEIFYFLEREARKLEELAWADSTLSAVSVATGIDISTLRNKNLALSHPKDGGWHFTAVAENPAQAEKIAAAWATAFYDQTQSAINASVQLGAAKAILVTDPKSDTLPAKIAELEATSKGILPGIETSLAQVEGLPIQELGQPAWYILAGGMAGLLLGLFWTLSLRKH